MSVKLLTEHLFEFLSLKGGYRGSLESALVEMPHFRKSHVTAQELLTWELAGLTKFQKTRHSTKYIIKLIDIHKNDVSSDRSSNHYNWASSRQNLS